MDRLIILEPPDLIIHFETERKSVGTLQLRNVMHTMPVAFKMECSAPKKFVFKPPHGIIAPVGVTRVDIIINPQEELPDSFPLCLDQFTVSSVLVPGGYSSRSIVSLDWFTSKKKAVFCDTRLKIKLVGGGILRDLVTRGSMDAVREALELDPKIADCTDEKGQTGMHIAVSLQRPEIVQLLLEFKVNLELKNKVGQTPLHQASSAGASLVTELLLANGANTDARNDFGWTALHNATVKGHYDAMDLLIDHGADIDAAIPDGRTAIHMAVAEGHKHCINLLVERGCNVDARSLDGGTPLHMASARGHVTLVKILLDSGASKEVRDSQGRTPYDEAVELGQTLLFDLLFLGDSLRESARKGDLRGVEKAIRSGAVTIDGEDQYGWTALHRAAFKGRIKVVKYLIEKGADVNRKDEDGYTALHSAVESCQKDVVQLLVEKGANVFEKTRVGMTPLQLASTLRYKGIVQILLQAGASNGLTVSLDQESAQLLRDIIAKGRNDTKMEVMLANQPYNIEKYLEPVSFDCPVRNDIKLSKGVSRADIDVHNRSSFQGRLLGFNGRPELECAVSI